MATDKQTFVGAAGLGLIAVNYWTGDQRKIVSNGLFNSNGDTIAAHKSLVGLAGELLFVGVAALLAGLSDKWGTAMSAVVVALFILWAINHYTRKTQTQTLGKAMTA